MAGYVRKLCINKTNSTYIIYDTEKNNQQVGKLNPREAYVVEGGGGDYLGISFLNSNGVWSYAMINSYEHPLPGQGPGDGYPYTSTCIYYPYGSATIDGTTYKTFKMRSTQKVYRGDGSSWGSVAGGCLVATNSDSVGADNSYLKLINYVQSTAGKWVKVQGAGYSHGFVDTGIRKASGYSKIPFYGSW